MAGFVFNGTLVAAFAATLEAITRGLDAYGVRQVELENLATQKALEILHFHYTTWPDFGVPKSTASFLNFLFKVQESGSLSPEHGPIVVYCSAGTGRSGTFCLADICLLLMDKRKDPSSVDIKKALPEMRRFCMGLIQMADLLCFSYLAVIEGAKFIMGDSSVQDQWKELSHEDLEPPPEHVLPTPRPLKCILDPHNGKCKELLSNHQWMSKETCENEDSLAREEGRDPLSAMHSMSSMSQDIEVRKRMVAGGLQGTQASVPTKEKPSPTDEEQKAHWLTHWKPFLVNVCMATALATGAYLCYRVCFH
ncbi:hypothetical protein U0070_005548 [Myodes glareolus]|uniref:protein-tyrosine-phosphatase n=1 Tax=Myodes glareolus TaxID=447135 RepID=A0AAW0IU91_MYOGA